MAALFQNLGQKVGIGRSNKSNGNAGARGGNASGMNTQSTSGQGNDGFMDVGFAPEFPKYFFQEKYAKLGVKGNFLPLAAQPKNMDVADWLAHQCSEQYRVVEQLVKIIQEVNGKTGIPICSPATCPVMSAGRSHTYTWLNSLKEPVKVPAAQYIGLVQRWIVGKLSDPNVFPTDPLTGTAATYASGGLNTPHANTPIPAGPTNLTAPLSQLAGQDWVGKTTGFPQNFLTDVKTIFRQMFRIYAHLYHSHWLDPFWHIRSDNPACSGWTDLNSCFVNYIIVAKLFGLLSEKDMEPMQPLIDIWIANGSIPQDAANSACVITQPQ